MESQLLSMGPKSADQPSAHEEERKRLEDQLKFLTKQLETAQSDLEAKSGEESKNSDKIKELDEELKQLRLKDEALVIELENEAKQRKKLHNTIEDMKGAVRVFCRMRPLSSSEVARGNSDITEYMPNKTSIRVYRDSKHNMDTSKTYSFDAVFSPVDGQEVVFEDVSRLVQSAVDGYNVCIFAYGQTGSEKTYTMNGVSQAPGIQPRSVQEIFNIVARDSDKFDFKISIYMVEMYLDDLNDLLEGTSGGKVIGKRDRKNKLQVRKGLHGQVEVHGVTHCIARTPSELNGILESGMRKRRVGSTKMNSESSRSHLVSSILIESIDRKTKLVTSGKLTLVDLAGSESQKKTGADGDTLKEANAINKSLSALGNVISELTSGKGHVSYRNSKLTVLLQDGLGGSAKTLMFVNASPADYNFTETCSSFEFALRCKKIKNSKSGASVENLEVKQLRARLKKLEARLEDTTEIDLEAAGD